MDPIPEQLDQCHSWVLEPPGAFILQKEGTLVFIPQAKFHHTEALLRSAGSHAAVDNFTSQSANRG